MRRLVASVALAHLLTGCAHTIDGQPTAPASLAWQRPITNAIANMGNAMGPVGDAMIARDYPAMRAGCTKLETAVDQIRSLLPTPDSAVTDALRDGVDNYGAFAKLCATITSSSGPVIDRLDTYLNRGTAGIRKALRLMGIELPRR